MDEIELMVAETFRHFRDNFTSLEEPAPVENSTTEPFRTQLPSDPGVIYHIQRGTSVFVIRTFVSGNIREDYLAIVEAPENYPSLRLIEGEDRAVESRLRFFVAETEHQAEVIHDQLNNRRFPMNEEMVCNISDPGFSWWLTRKESTLQLAFNLSSFLEDETIKLGPLGDRELALQSFLKFGDLLNRSGLQLGIQNELNRVVFEDPENLLLDEVQDLFEMGVIGSGMTELFKLLARKTSGDGELESLWYYFQEVAAIRRFWVQVQYDLEA